jgi:hypothetical protein
MKRTDLDYSTYVRFLREKANTQLYNSDKTSRNNKDRTASITSNHKRTLMSNGLFREFAGIVSPYIPVDTPVEEIRNWYINTLTSTIANGVTHVKYLNNNLYYRTGVRIISVRDIASGNVTPVAGNGTNGAPVNGTLATLSNIYSINSLHVDGNNNIYIATNAANNIFMIPAVDGNYFGVSSMLANRIYSITGTGSGGHIVSGTLALSSLLQSIVDMTIDYQGNLFFTNTVGANTVDSQCVAMMPSANGTFFGQVMEVGKVYIVAGNTNFANNGYDKLATDANLNAPEGVITDGVGNLIISDSFNGRIGMVPRVAGTYFGVDMPTVGHIYLIAGNGINTNNTGDGGPAIAATLRVPSRMVLDTNGNLYFSDRFNHRIRRITSAGIISNIAGNSASGFGLGGFGGDGGLAVNSQLFRPTGLAISGNNTIYVADDANSRIRVLTNVL